MAYTRRFVGGSAGGAGSGTVTNTGNLTANHLVIGNGGVDESVLASLGTTTTVLHGNAAGAPTFAGVSLTADAAANQGTTTTVLHGNAAGQPTFAAVNLAADVGVSILPPANGGVAVVSVAGQGYFVSDGRLNSAMGYTDIITAAVISASNNQVKVAQFVLSITASVTRISATFGSATAGTANFGIYDAPGTTLLINSGNFNANSATTQTLTIGVVTLPPGVYWFAAACSNNTTTATSFANTATTPSFQIWNAVTPRIGTAANSSAGSLPATLGAITSTAVILPMVMFEFA